MIKQILFTVSMVLFSTHILTASPIEISISGNITDQNAVPLNGCNITLINSCDHPQELNQIVENAYFQFQVSPCTKYTLICTKIGFDTLVKIINNNEDSMITVQLVLHPNTKQINEVEIHRINTAITVKGDKIIVDAQKLSPGATSTALDLLMRCPGVIVNEQNNSIVLKGKNGVIIMVNDVLQPLRGEDLFNWLRNQPAENIEKIELIGNPSARYDASGTAGIINFKMKRNRQQGINGSISSGAGQGRYGKFSQGINLNYAKNGISLYNNYNFASRKGFNQLYLQRNFYKNDTFVGAYLQRNYLRFPINTHSFRSGLDWNKSKKISMGTAFSGSSTEFRPNGKNYSTVLGNDGKIASFFTTINDSKDKRNNAALNAYLKVNLDTSGSAFTTDLDLAYFSNLSKQLFTTSYFNENYMNFIPDYLLGGDQKSKLKIGAIKSDWIQTFKDNRILETGFKASHVVADNDLKFFDRSLGNNILDSSKSNHFVYTENIIAAYAQGSVKIGTIAIQGGLRFEQTLAKGLQWVNNENFNKKYGQLFPSITIQKATQTGGIAGFSITRRIDRPDYQSLNPFKFYLDPTTYKAGNPALNPQFTWSGEIQFISAKGQTVTFSANRTKKMITEVIYPSEFDPKITIQTNKNLQDFSNILLSAATPINLGKKCKGYWSVVSGYQFFSGNIANSPINKGSLVIIASGSQTVILHKTWTADINGSFQSGQVYAYMKLKALGQLGMGIQHNFWKRSGSLKLSVTDIFWTGNPSAENAFAGYTETFVVKRETRVAMLSFSWRWGQPQGTQKRRQGGAEEEKQRAQGNIG